MNEAKDPLLSGPKDPTPQKTCKNYKKGRLRRTRTCPVGDAVHLDIKEMNSIPRANSIFGNIHPSFRKVGLLLVIYLGCAAVCFYLVRHQIDGVKTNGLLDAIYFTIVTMTTVGYGDLVPNSDLAKLLACAFVFSGMALVGLILSKAADYLVEKQEILLVKALHMHQKVGRSEMLKEIETNKAKYKFFLSLFLLLGFIIVGTVFLIKVEKLSPVDAFYCVCSTITTLGYGDKSFSTVGGRVFAVFWILMGTICVAQFFLYLAEFNTEKRQREIVNWVLTRKMTNLDLEAADMDDDGRVGVAEFVVYKLKEMGKIDQEDINMVLEEFEELDVDQSGTLSTSDLIRAESSQPERAA